MSMEKPSSAASEPAEGVSVNTLEYEAQLFDHTAATVTDDVYNIMYDYSHDVVKSVYDYFTSKWTDIDKEVIRKGSEAFKSELTSEAESICLKLESQLSENIMKIPDDVILPEDACHMDVNLTDIDEYKVDLELRHLRNQIDQEINAYQNLRAEKKKLQCLLDAHRKAQQNHSVVLDNKIEAELAKLPKIIEDTSIKTKELLNELTN